MQELKRIDLQASKFECNGKVYHIMGSLSVERFCEYQILEKEAGFNVNFKTMFKELKESYELLNKMKAADAAVKLHNLMSGVAKMEQREPTLLKICALFMNTDEEDITKISSDLISRKIDDWKQEYDVRDFFTYALNTLDGLVEVYNSEFRNTSEDTPEKA